MSPDLNPLEMSSVVRALFAQVNARLRPLWELLDLGLSASPSSFSVLGQDSIVLSCMTDFHQRDTNIDLTIVLTTVYRRVSCALENRAKLDCSALSWTASQLEVSILEDSCCDELVLQYW
jgi:hypothetical protein